jgi:flagellar hook-associated protein 1 FlgK
MGGLTSALNIGKTSLLTSQKTIEVTGNNIANVNTPGYSRQIPILSSYPTVQINGQSFGTGVKIDQVMRNHDTFLQRQLGERAATAGEAEARTAPLAQVEQVVSIAESSIAGEISRFFDSWQQLSADPSSGVLRNQVLQRGQTLAGGFNSTIRELATAQEDINVTLESKVEAVNFKLNEVATLNQRIASLQIKGQDSLSDRDRRDQLVNELASSLGVSYFEGENGMVSLQLPGGHTLVQDATAMTLEPQRVNGDVQFALRAPRGGAVALSPGNFGGEFRGLMAVRDSHIPGVIADLDKLAYNLLNEVNTLHQTGSGLDGLSGRDFFAPVAVEAGAASQIAVALTQGNQLAAGTGAAPGDNRNALQLAALSSKKVIGGTETFTGFYANLASRVGTEVQQNSLTRMGSEDSLLQLQNRRDSSAGVSLEEEMINLIMFQKGFEASAKLLSTVDEMMDSLLSLKR